MSKFLTELVIKCCPTNENLWQLEEDLVYQSDLVGLVTVPAGLWTDLASTRHIPLVSFIWGSTAHREGVLHDYLFRVDANPVVSFAVANSVFIEAMEARGKSIWVKYPMFWGVWIGGYFSYHEKKVDWQPGKENDHDCIPAVPKL
jgi:hypothetical protein